MKRLAFFISLATLCALCFYQCGDDGGTTQPPPTAQCPPNVTYTNGAKAVLDANCAVSGCHDASTQIAGIDWSNYDGAKAAAEGRPLLCAINHNAGCTPMPFNRPKLSDANIQTLTCWVQQGLIE